MLSHDVPVGVGCRFCTNERETFTVTLSIPASVDLL